MKIDRGGSLSVLKLFSYVLISYSGMTGACTMFPSPSHVLIISLPLSLSLSFSPHYLPLSLSPSLSLSLSLSLCLCVSSSFSFPLYLTHTPKERTGGQSSGMWMCVMRLVSPFGMQVDLTAARHTTPFFPSTAPCQLIMNLFHPLSTHSDLSQHTHTLINPLTSFGNMHWQESELGQTPCSYSLSNKLS